MTNDQGRPVGPMKAAFLLGDQPNLPSALCRDADTADNPWFPDPRTKGYKAQIQHAKETCALCPELRPCLDWALNNYEIGVWGGTDAEDRINIRRRNNIDRRQNRQTERRKAS